MKLKLKGKKITSDSDDSLASALINAAKNVTFRMGKKPVNLKKKKTK